MARRPSKSTPNLVKPTCMSGEAAGGPRRGKEAKPQGLRRSADGRWLARCPASASLDPDKGVKLDKEEEQQKESYDEANGKKYFPNQKLFHRLLGQEKIQLSY
ncbi:hypothetical protein AV530_003687 [Patagioenas fasciata monilis]|uniref:Uncharacterized protein n=1 Tax=Patagioenas fasciata monilis TaxID=372326 RepID=A0A1V4KY94_PATFA|nr:hypothetical protein AV530_003687 [Patagioenas fasciata monilis]